MYSVDYESAKNIWTRVFPLFVKLFFYRRLSTFEFWMLLVDFGLAFL